MINNDPGTGGAPIRPSARRSIHADGRCTFACCTGMGRYGLSRSNNVQNQFNPAPDNNQGTDEVDNVMSKIAHASSAIPAQRNKELRRYSVELLNPLQTDDSSDSVLAKSLPASLPSHYISSKESGDFLSNDHHNSSVASNRSATSQISSNNTSSNEILLESVQDYNASPIYQGRQATSQHNYNASPPIYHGRQATRQHNYNASTPIYQRRQSISQHNKKSPPIYTGISLLGVISIAVAYYYGEFLGDDNGTLNANKYDQLKFYNDLNDLGMKYRIRDNSILQVQTGISTIFQRQDSGSFIFTYNSNTNYFDPNEFNKFIETLASTTTRYLRNDSTSVKHILIESTKLEMRSPIELVNKYREDISKTGLMLVKDIDRVPSTLAMAFHYYCDEYNPIAKRSAIFFTLDMAKCNTDSAYQKPTHASIEKCLAKKWKGVPEDHIGPLLTRVVNVVVDVNSI